MGEEGGGCHVFIKGTYIHVWLDESLYFEPEKRYFCSSLSANETVKVKKTIYILKFLKRNLAENGWKTDKRYGYSLLGIVLPTCACVCGECGLSE